MITKVNFHNWKSFSDAELFIDPLTFLIGTNASGKSNALDALSFLRDVARGVPIYRAICRVRGGEDVVIRKGEKSFSLSVRIQDDLNTYEYIISIGKVRDGSYTTFRESLLLQRSDSDKKQCVFESEIFNDDHLYIETRIGNRALRIKRSNSLELTASLFLLDALPLQGKSTHTHCKVVVQYLRNIFVLYADPRSMRDYTPVSQLLKEDGSNVAGVLAAYDRAEKSQIEQQITEYVKPLPEKDIKRVWAEKVGELGKDAMLYVEEDWADEPVIFDAKGMSDGTLRFIAIVIALLTRPKSSLIAIEEADNGLHPSRSEELVNVLKKIGKEREIDILCTTHNPVLIDTLGNKMLPFISYVKRDISGVSQIKLLEDVENLAKLMAANSMGDMMIKGLL